MKLKKIIFLILFSIHMVYPGIAQFKRGLIFQYAGSTGYGSIGYMAGTKGGIEFSGGYGFTPKFSGGLLHTLNLKLSFNLKKIKLYKEIEFSPLLIGGFVTATFNKNLKFNWGRYYPDNYYWWPRNFRQHVFVGSQIEFPINFLNMERLAVYIEGNTNDLYLVSFFSNRRSLKFADIIFFGAGIKIYRE